MKSITIIGAGAVGRSIALALFQQGARISAVYSQGGKSAKLLAKQCSADTFGAMNGAVRLSDTVIIAVPDGAIPDVVRMLEGAKRKLTGQVFLHTSGALTSDELLPLKKCGAMIGSFHPLQTFPKSRKRTEFVGNWFAVEGDPNAVKTSARLAAMTGAKHFLVPKKDKTLYHIAAVFASNYQVTLFSVVEQLAQSIRMPKRDLWRIFRPLVTRTIENVFTSSPAEALTGPIARGDYRTIMKHIAALETSKSLSHLVPLYSALGVETTKLAKRKR